jgi:hypothetical protein
MKEITIGDRTFHLVVGQQGGEWKAHAERVDTGDSFGIECTEATEAAATERLIAWLTWQHEHTDALEALQQAERAYHRTIAGSAFATPGEGPTAIELQKESLNAVEAARLRLDDVRARKPS